MKKGKDDKARRGDVVRLEDLAPRDDVKGGAARKVFGERHDASSYEDLPPASKERPGKRAPRT